MTPIPRKLARLYLVADILANSAAPLPSAWKYRSAFEPKLGAVFEHLNGIYKSFPGRMKAEGFKNQIMGVVNVWEAMLVFTPGVIEEFAKKLAEGANVLEEVSNSDDGMPMADVAEENEMRGFKRLNAAQRTEKKKEIEDNYADLDGEEIDGEAIE